MGLPAAPQPHSSHPTNAFTLLQRCSAPLPLVSLNSPRKKKTHQTQKPVVNVILHQIVLQGAESQFWGNVSQPTFKLEC